MSHEDYEDNRWDARMEALDWEDSEERYNADVNTILLRLTKEQHARLQYLYEEKQMYKKILDDFRAVFYQLNAAARLLINYDLSLQIKTNNYTKAFNAYIEFVSNWHGLCEFYDGR